MGSKRGSGGKGGGTGLGVLERSGVVAFDVSSVTQAVVAQVFGVSDRAVRKWSEEGEEEGRCPRNEDGSYSLPAVVQWWREKFESQIEEFRQATKSPGIERKRMADAQMAELRLAQMQRVLIPRDDIQAVWGVMAARLRQCGVLLRRKFGDGAGGILDDAIDDASFRAKRFMEEQSAGDGGQLSLGDEDLDGEGDGDVE